MKKSFLLSKLVLLSCVATLFSCDPAFYTPDPYIVPETRQKENVYYTPASPNVPLLAEKNDGSFSVSYANNPKHSGVDLTTAFIPATSFGLMGAYSQYSHKGTVRDGKLSHYQFGAGYLKPLGQLHFEIYGGIGGGSIMNGHHTGQSKINFTNYFIQPTIAVQNLEKTIQFAFVSKFSSQHFKIKDTTYNGGREPFVTSQLKLINDKPNRLLWEPGIVLRAGVKNVLFQVAFSAANDFSKQDFSMDKTNISFGLVFRGNLTDQAKGK